MSTQGLSKLLNSTELNKAEVFVREAIQNSVDAQHPDAKEHVRIAIKSRTLDTPQQMALNEFLLSHTLQRHIKAAIETESDRRAGTLADATGNARLAKNTRVLTVEDFNTKGLGGDLGKPGPESHFTRLVYHFGQSHDNYGSQGGAYGFGKTAYSAASKSSTVIYYSKPADGNPSRLIAVSLLPEHEVDGEHFTGYALCGIESGSASYPRHPVAGEAADELAERLGLTPRSAEQTGTSIMVLDSNYTAAELKGPIETWWWPRLETVGLYGLSVTLQHEGEPQIKPEPRRREDLRGFIQAHDHQKDARRDRAETKTYTIKSTGKREVGKLTFQAVEGDGIATQASTESDELDENADVPKNTVALMRGPRLVVAYQPAGVSQGQGFCGVFESTHDMNPVLRQAENQTHDLWTPTANDLGDKESKYVRAIYKWIKLNADEFQAQFEERAPDSPSRLRQLEDVLGSIFRQGKKPGPVPQGAERPVSLSVVPWRDENPRTQRARITIVADGDEATAQIPCRIRVYAEVLGDTRHTKIGTAEVEILDHDGNPKVKGDPAEVVLTVKSNEPSILTAIAETDEKTTVKFAVDVDGAEESA